MPRKLIAIRIQSKVFRVNPVYLEAVSLWYFGNNYQVAKKSVNKYLNSFFDDFIELSPQIIEEEIFKGFLPHSLQKKLNNVAYMQ